MLAKGSDIARSAVAASLLVFSVPAACVSLGPAQTASTLGKGKMQLGIEQGLSGAAAGGGTGLYPRTDVAFRYGVTEAIDLGGRMGSSGLEGLAKLQLKGADGERLEVAAAPSAGGSPVLVGRGGTILHVTTPLLVGLRAGGRWQLVVGPRFVAAALVRGGGVVASTALVGGSVGVSCRLGGRVRLLPELSLAYPVSGSSVFTGIGSYAVALGENLALQFTLAVLFGEAR